MKKKPHKWLERLVDKITKDTQPNNDYFVYYNHNVTLQSGTVDYVGVTIQDLDSRNQISFNFDFWTCELVFECYNDYDERDAIIKGFKSIYNGPLHRVRVIDEPWQDEMEFLKPMLGNDEYDQDEVQKEYNALMERKV